MEIEQSPVHLEGYLNMSIYSQIRTARILFSSWQSAQVWPHEQAMSAGEEPVPVSQTIYHNKLSLWNNMRNPWGQCSINLQGIKLLMQLLARAVQSAQHKVLTAILAAFFMRFCWTHYGIHRLLNRSRSHITCGLNFTSASCLHKSSHPPPPGHCSYCTYPHATICIIVWWYITDKCQPLFILATHAKRGPPCDRSNTCRGLSSHWNLCSSLAPWLPPLLGLINTSTGFM